MTDWSVHDENSAEEGWLGNEHVLGVCADI